MTLMEEDKNNMDSGKPGRFNVWMMAVRPKTLIAAAVPVLLASSLAAADGRFLFYPFLAALLFALLMQADANMINDLYDFLKGSDGEERLGPPRMCSKGWISMRSMKIGILLVSFIACLAGSSLLLYGGIWMIWVGVAALLFAFAYTAGPYPLAYHGFGDLLVLLFFGFVPVLSVYYIMADNLPAEAFILSFSCGMVIDTLLLLNNYRDRVQDRDNGKRTLVVILGKDPDSGASERKMRVVGERLYLYSGIAAAVSAASLYFFGYEYTPAVMLYLVLHFKAYGRMRKLQGKDLNEVLGMTSVNMAVFGLMLAFLLLMEL